MDEFRQNAFGDEEYVEILDIVQDSDIDEERGLGHDQEGQLTSSLNAGKERADCSATTSVTTRFIWLMSSRVTSTSSVSYLLTYAKHFTPKYSHSKRR